MTLFSRLAVPFFLAIVAGCAHAAENDAGLRGATGATDLMELEENTVHFDLAAHARRLFEVEEHDLDHTRRRLDDGVLDFNYELFIPGTQNAFGGANDEDGDTIPDNREPPACRGTPKRADGKPAKVWTNEKMHPGFSRSFQGCTANQVCPCVFGGVDGKGWPSGKVYKKCIAEALMAFEKEGFIDATEKAAIHAKAENDASTCYQLSKSKN